MSNPSFEKFLTDRWPYETLGVHHGGDNPDDDRMTIGMIHGDRCYPITFPGDDHIERGFNRRIASLTKQDADLTYCALNLGHRYAIRAITHALPRLSLADRLRILFGRLPRFLAANNPVDGGGDGA